MKVLHISDLHFGRKNLPNQIDVLLTLIERERFDVVAVSGDLTQRARKAEFETARAFLERVEQFSKVIAVPGNHDCTWWRAPMHLGPRSWMYAKWRRFLGRETEPVLEVPGVTFIGVATALGISVHTLTKRLRDLSVLGDMRPEQLARVRAISKERAAHEYRVVVMHHNPLQGQISERSGFKRGHAERILREFADAGVEIVLCGHDHQEAVHFVEQPARGIVVVNAGTITTMSRGKRPTAVHIVELDPAWIDVRTLAWNTSMRDFARVGEQKIKRAT